ncbi:DMT family transporter [Arthrobacter sp. KFRI-F3372]|uniref:Transporter family-2 protein n=1 Tax=Pseudarthrobacter oxydans TaxID=1671 RepID=A0AAW8N7H2_PSEOX|nr:DMT family transporter [Pseudarthrobacter oxydans]MDR6791435.1 transporter family-2 protein [Pseudarthrobacter oxydans]MDR7162915.1 transporter family-2 protein [Pseudarthrobacter oxydans]MDV2977554.1 DMT family transporter [Actinomycetes bacterium ARC8]WHP60671.1 DMT family transporter [Arthrobacter sp. KFRI-F3372]
MTSSPRLPLLAGLPLAVGAGLAIPVQGRINGALGTRLNDGIAAAVVSFSTGLVVMILISLLLPRGRAGLAKILPAVRSRAFPRIYVLAGGIGALFVFAQSFTVGILGVALFTVATVTGQTVSGLLVDKLGIGPAGRKPVTAIRVIGCLLTIAAVAWAVSPRFAATGGTPGMSAGGGAGPDGPAALLVPLLLPVAAGFLMSFQQAMNGTATVHYGTPIAATLVNFVAGSVVLWTAYAVKVSVAGPGNPLPAEWWYYLGGPMGCVFIGLGALLVRSLGVLVTGLGMIAGQLLGSLALDVVLPAPGTIVAPATVLGTILTLAAIILATLPWPRGALRR